MESKYGWMYWQRKLNKRPWQTEQDNTELASQLQRQVVRYSTSAARILIYGNHTVLAQVTTPLVVQVDGLLANNLVEEAMQLAEQAQNTISNDSNVYVERLRAELDYTYQKSGLLLLKETVFDDAFTLLSKGNMDPRIIVHMFEGLSQSKWLQEAPPILLYDDARALVEELKSIKDIVNHSLQEFASPNDTEDSPSGAPEMRRVLLLNAREALNKYLLKERAKRQDRLGQGDTLCKVIDTCLLKIYMSQKDDKAIYQLLQQPNDCSAEDCSKALLKAKVKKGASYATS